MISSLYFQENFSTKKIWDEQSKYDAADISEILMAFDPENMYFINDMNPRCGAFHDIPRVALSKCGMPYTVCSFDDMKELDMTRFKLVIMCHPFELSDEKHRFLEEHLFNADRSIIWMYGPGVINKGKWEPDNVKNICGAEFGAEGIKAMDMNGWKSIYIHRPELITPEDIQAIAVQAGCHLYCAEPRPIYANERLIGTHTAISEKIKINLKNKITKVTELFSGKTWFDTDHVELESKGPDSFLLLIEKDK